MTVHTFDPECLELARHFNDRDLTDKQLAALAQHIQDVVEDYFMCLDIDAAEAAATAELERQEVGQRAINLEEPA